MTISLKSLALVSVGSSALLATGVVAADLPVRAPAPAPVMMAPLFTWSGFYVGLNAGWGGDRFSYPWTFDDCSNGPNSCVLYSGSRKLNSSGFLGGAQVGYNWQFTNNLVFGLEADYQFANVKGSTGIFGGFDNNDEGAEFLAGSKVTGFGTVRARLGFAIDRTLVYATGGWAYGRVKNTIGYDICGNDCYAGNASRSFNYGGGWTAGAGVEYAFTNNLSAKVEYLFVDLGSKRIAAYSDNLKSARLEVDTRFHVVRAGLNYRFWTGGAGPVVARY